MQKQNMKLFKEIFLQDIEGIADQHLAIKTIEDVNSSNSFTADDFLVPSSQCPSKFYGSIEQYERP